MKVEKNIYIFPMVSQSAFVFNGSPTDWYHIYPFGVLVTAIVLLNFKSTLFCENHGLSNIGLPEI